MTDVAVSDTVKPNKPGWRQPLPVDWEQIRSAFLECQDFRKVATQFNIKYDTLYQRARRQGWLKSLKPASVRARLHTQVAKAVDKLEASADRLPLRDHADTLSTVARTAALVEGWATNSGTVQIAVVTSAQRDAVDLTPECIDVESSTTKDQVT